MLNYNVLNDFVEKLKNAGITIDELKAVAKAYSDGDVQHTLTAGNNITIVDNVISATSGSRLYLHNLNCLVNYPTYNGRIVLKIISTVNTPMTRNDIVSYLTTNGHITTPMSLQATGYYENHAVNSIYYEPNNDTLYYVYNTKDSTSFSPNQINDIITEL